MSIKSEIRISRYLAKAGLASRREAEKLILDGRVTLNGDPVIEPWRSCNKKDVLKLDGVIVSQIIPTVIYQLNKPKGYLSTSKDALGRRTIFDLIESKLEHLMIIGRLDDNSEGLMILTNNGLNYKPIEVRFLKCNRSYSWIEMVLTEGKNREIRKILANFNLTVVRLIRNRFGPFNLDDLQAGKSKELKLNDYSVLRNYWT